MPDSIFAEQFKSQPYWWDGAEEAEHDVGTTLPRTADVVVVGSGFTGLSTALTLAREGRDVLVLDADRPGFGCSTRNGGQVGPCIRTPYSLLSRRFGKDHAYALKKEGHDAYHFLTRFLDQEGIDCNFHRSGHFLGAHSPNAYARLRQLFESEPPEFERMTLVAPADTRQEVGTDALFGGIVYPDCGGLNPKRYHDGLLDKVRKAGARVVGHCRVVGVQTEGKGLQVTTEKQTVAARNVVLATNGYTRGATPWWQRRIIPIGSYIIATDPIDPALMRQLCPKGRMMHETRTAVYYYRPSPDGTRILFGGRAAGREISPRDSAPRLFAAMSKLFPELKSARVTHSWLGYAAFSFDRLPHFGEQAGIHYAMAYCGNGVPLSTFLGWRIANSILGRPEGRSVLERHKFRTRPFYRGNPWFLAPSVAYYKFKDAYLS